MHNWAARNTQHERMLFNYQSAHWKDYFQTWPVQYNRMRCRLRQGLYGTPTPNAIFLMKEDVILTWAHTLIPAWADHNTYQQLIENGESLRTLQRQSLLRWVSSPISLPWITYCRGFIITIRILTIAILNRMGHSQTALVSSDIMVGETYNRA